MDGQSCDVEIVDDRRRTRFMNVENGMRPVHPGEIVTEKFVRSDYPIINSRSNRIFRRNKQETAEQEVQFEDRLCVAAGACFWDDIAGLAEATTNL